VTRKLTACAAAARLRNTATDHMNGAIGSWM
jgi:hypothetical protein